MREEMNRLERGKRQIKDGSADLTRSDFYRLERQIGKTAPMISFHLKTGTQRAFSVIGFEEICYQPEKGVTLFSHKAIIVIEGRSLEELYRHLTHRRVNEVREFSEKEERRGRCFITAITIESDNE